jgi:hypothetical protein
MSFEGAGPLPRGKPIEDSSGVFLLPITPNVCEDLNRCERTIKRWLNDPQMKMPRPRRIRNRLYFTLSEYEEWKRDFLLTALDHATKPGAAAPARVDAA